MADGTHPLDEELFERLRTTDEEIHPLDDPSRFSDAFGYQPTRYGQLEKVADFLRLGRDDVFVDLGCGKGRVVCYMALLSLRKVVGVEIRPDLAAVARENVARLSPSTPVEIVVGDAAEYRSTEATVYYLFNPFGRKTVSAVLDNVRAGWEAAPRPVRIVYNNTVHGDVLDAQPWLDRGGGGIPGWGIRVWRTIPPAIYRGDRRQVI